MEKVSQKLITKKFAGFIDLKMQLTFYNAGNLVLLCWDIHTFMLNICLGYYICTTQIFDKLVNVPLSVIMDTVGVFMSVCVCGARLDTGAIVFAVPI